MTFKTKALYSATTSLAEEDAKVYGDNITLLDVHSAVRFYPILVQLAKQQKTVTYGEMCVLVHERYHDWANIDSVIPVRCGRVLGVIGQYLQDKDLPFLQALVMNQSKKDRCGDGIEKVMDTVVARQEVFDFEWDNTSESFGEYIVMAEELVIRAKKKAAPVMGRGEALTLMSDYHKQHKANLPKKITKYREEVISQIKQSDTVKEAFDTIIAQHALTLPKTM